MLIPFFSGIFLPFFMFLTKGLSIRTFLRNCVELVIDKLSDCIPGNAREGVTVEREDDFLYGRTFFTPLGFKRQTNTEGARGFVTVEEAGGFVLNPTTIDEKTSSELDDTGHEEMKTKNMPK